MARNPWSGTDAGWPYERFSFSASVATHPIGVRGPLAGPLPEHGWHTSDHGALALIVAGCSALAIVQWHVGRARRGS